jgi:hypothetical protein
MVEIFVQVTNHKNHLKAKIIDSTIKEKYVFYRLRYHYSIVILENRKDTYSYKEMSDFLQGSLKDNSRE